MPTRFFDRTIVGTAEEAVDFIGNILESSTEYSIIGRDLDGKILLWNEGARRLYGYEPEEVVGRANSRILDSPDDVAAGRPQQMFDAVLRDGHWEGTIARRRKNGSQFMARVVVTPRRDAAGKAIGFLLMSRDVSNELPFSEELRKAKLFDSAIVSTVELARVASLLNLQRIALESANAIFITDSEGVIVWVNPAFTTMTGYSAEEAIGKTPRILKSGRHNEEFYRGFWETIRSGRMWRGEFVNRRKDGTVYYDEQTVIPVGGADRAITHFISVKNDITKRKQAEEQLRDAHAQMSELLAHSPAVLYAGLVEGETIITRFASENVTRLLGFQVAETLSMEWWRGQLHPEDRARAEASITETLTQGATCTEYRLRHKDGTYRWVEDNRRLVRDAAGKPAELVGVWTDITGRKRTQDELHESERRFREMHNNLELVSLMFDRDARITYCNDYFLRLTGWRREEVVGCDWFERFVPNEQISELREAFSSLFANRPEVWHHTNEILTRSGERRLMQWNNSVLRSTSGEVIGAASIGEDITSRTLAESELRRSEEQLRTIIRASNDAIWERNVATGELYWSDRAFSMLGHTRETFQPTFETLGALVHPDDAGIFQAALDGHLKRGEPYQVRMRLRHANGSYVPVLARGQLQRETGRMLGVFTDLSIVERADEQIRDQAALLDQAHDAIIVRDLNDRITFWSKGAERLYGWTAKDALGRRSDELLHVDARESEPAKKAAIADGAWSGEVEKTTAAGQTVVVDCSWTILRDDQGRPKSILVIETNITDRKTLEQQFFRAQRLESLGTLASGIAHDLNNLLMPILMGVTLLKRLEPDERSLRAINNIESSVRRGTDLVKQVLMFARGVEGSRTAVDVARIVAEVRAIVESTFPKNIALATTMPRTLSNVFADATQLNQVLLNLCVNARDAMPGGGQITISAADTDIDLQYAVMHGGTTAGRYVVLEVADNGSGMTKEVVDRIFEPFFTTKELGKGTGLGLSTARGIVRSHGGFIDVSSEVGRGSTFRVYLPAHSRPAAANTIEAETEHVPHGRGEVILVVDDEASIRAITKETLESFGYAVLTAEDGAQAIGLYAREQANIAAVLTDLMMPVMDGAALIAALRRINPEVPIIAVSGHTEPDLMAQVTKAGATSFLFKPYSAEVMLRTLFQVLGGSSVRAT